MPRRKRNRMPARQTRNIYVIILRRGVLKERKFREMNPLHKGRRLCLYVRLSALKPEDRFQQHLEGKHSSRIVKRYGRRVFAERSKQITSLYPTALKRERRVAQLLREQGYAVWQN